MNDQLKRLRIPEVIRVGNKVIEVQVVKGLHRIEDAVGLYDDEEGEHVISLDPAQSRLELERTLVHELLHAIWPKDAIPQKIEKKYDVEESIIGKLEKPLHDLIASGQLHLPKGEE